VPDSDEPQAWVRISARSGENTRRCCKPSEEKMDGAGTPNGVSMSKNKVVEIPTCPVSPRGFRVAEAAAYMGVSPWFVEQEIRAGRLPALKLCRHYTVLKEDLDAYLDAARKQVA
jgi:excisionase family DNA binding protein